MSGAAPATHVPTQEPPEPVAAYDRGAWRHWIDEDGDCQDTRTEVLIAESEIPVTFADERECMVVVGRWTCPYTGHVFRHAWDLDIDHVVSLREAHDGGGYRWGPATRETFANDLRYDHALIAVAAGANRSKGSRTLAEWLPEREAFRCEYVEIVATVKAHWNLELTAAEVDALAFYRRLCAAGLAPEVDHLALDEADRETLVTAAQHRDPPPGASSATPTAAPATPRAITATSPPGTSPGSEAPSRACCRVCTTGKACGDSCIARDKTCRKRRGCAC